MEKKKDDACDESNTFYLDHIDTLPLISKLHVIVLKVIIFFILYILQVQCELQDNQVKYLKMHSD